ncbi:DPL1 [Candida theae]|uniref:sphinganine-1-phosphate aldolase n=1 Tax=Candida theae TaxID=1198502 RepID=A0AAD5BCF3_9ASCO|nr:DPL1 [Candida theae]KAI5950444.1 DPL1 [Candida theae]
MAPVDITVYWPKSLGEIPVTLSTIYHQLKLQILVQYYSSNDNVWGSIYLARDLLFVLFVYHAVVNVLGAVWAYGITGIIKKLFVSVYSTIVQKIMSLPFVKSKIDKQLSETIKQIEDQVIQNDDSLLQFKELPSNGLSSEVVSTEVVKSQDLKHTDWVNGRVSGAVYHGGDDLLNLQSEAYRQYSVANQLHPDVFPGLRKMEAEVVAMVLDIFNAPEGACGCTASGGTESLLLTGLAAREYGRKYKGITAPEVIAPITIHAGIEKACFYFGMKLHKVDLDPKTYKVDVGKVKRLINKNTVLICGSAPNYPHGIIDDIEALSKLAVKHDIPLHVDACLGSFIVSFLESSKVHAPEKLPLFDFRVPGVTSISCDTHKYGFAPKGSSIIMYRSPKMRECQYYISSDWTGGMYGSPTLAGSRPGALMVGCWATLVHIGKDGYRKNCFEIVNATIKLKNAIETHPVLSKYLEVIGDPLCSVIAFKVKSSQSDNLSIYELGDLLGKQGWHFATLQHPAALHFALTRLTVPVIDELIRDLISSTEEAVEYVKKNGKPQGDTAAMYGVAGSIHTSGLADKLITAFIDSMYKM